MKQTFFKHIYLAYSLVLNIFTHQNTVKLQQWNPITQNFKIRSVITEI